MANPDIVKGFEPHGPCLRARKYVAAGLIYPGDLVKTTNAGKITPCAASDTACRGVAMEYASADGVSILVADHPDQEFVGQVAASEVDAQTDLNLNADIVVGTPNTTYKRSAMEIDGSTLATTSTLPLKLLRIDGAVNNALGANAKCIFILNTHDLKSVGTAGV